MFKLNSNKNYLTFIYSNIFINSNKNYVIFKFLIKLLENLNFIKKLISKTILIVNAAKNRTN